jgi:Flp pilus assembly protein TadG
MFNGNRVPTSRPDDRHLKRAAVIVYVTVSMAVIVGMAALAVDIGMLYSAQAEIQRTADATALAAAVELLDENRLRGDGYLAILEEDARQSAVEIAACNGVLRTPSIVLPDSDVQFGYITDLTSGVIAFDSPNPPNAVSVQVRRDDARGGSIALYFARFLGSDTKVLAADAVAAFADGISGFEVTPDTGNAQLLPFTLHIDSWNGLVSGLVTTGDNYAYDPDTGTVSPGSDGILELNLYPGAGADQLPPGNFGTVDIGSPGNSASDISRQILYGVSAEDLAYFGGTLEFGPDGTLTLYGDTGLSAGFKSELEAIKGQPRIIPIFSEVSGPGNNAIFTIVEFTGIRIMNVKLTGKMKCKNVIIQPAVVVDDSAIDDPTGGSSYFVYRPVQLVR